MPVARRSRSFASMSESARGSTAAFAFFVKPRSVTVSLSVPAALHDGQAPNHWIAAAPHS